MQRYLALSRYVSLLSITVITPNTTNRDAHVPSLVLASRLPFFPRAFLLEYFSYIDHISLLLKFLQEIDRKGLRRL